MGTVGLACVALAVVGRSRFVGRQLLLSVNLDPRPWNALCWIL
jgi:hypothetical protein